MKEALKQGTLDLPKKYEAARSRFEEIIARADRKPPVQDASRDVLVHLKKQVIVSPEFLELWQRNKQKTAYRVHIDTDWLIEHCVKALKDMPAIPKARLVTQTADIHIEHAGIYHMERGMRTEDTPIGSYNPDWAVYLTRNGEEKQYFVLETKGSENPLDRRSKENQKFHCGKKHFEALDSGVEVQLVKSWQDTRMRI